MSILNRVCCLSAFLYICIGSAVAQSAVIWKIGEADNTPSGMALAPDKFSRFVGDDFGYEDHFFLIGHSSPQTEWPYVQPGPANGWGGTGNTTGIRSHVLSVKFDIAAKPATGTRQLLIDVLEIDFAARRLACLQPDSLRWTSRGKTGQTGQRAGREYHGR